MSVLEVLAELNIDVWRENGNEILALCPGHKERTGKEDHNPSWWINSETGQHICFSCGFKGNLTYLVAVLRGVKNKWGLYDFEGAKRWIDQFGGVSLETSVAKIGGEEYLKPTKDKGLPEATLSVYGEPPDWALEKRKLDRDAVKFYGLLWDDEEADWICPIRNAYSGSLMGWQTKGEGHKNFRFRPSGIKASHTVFGIDRYTGGRMFVVESPLDAVRLLSLGIPGGVSTFGASISDEQFILLRRADNLLVAMDNPRIDAAGLKASEDFLKAGRRLRFDFKFFQYLTDAKDIGDMSEEKILEGMKAAKHSVFGKRAIGAL